MGQLELTVLRGVCQTPAYVAHDLGFFADEGPALALRVVATATVTPGRLAAGDSQFAVMPWTRAASAPAEDGFVVICGSGVEEAAVVVRAGLDPAEVRSVTVPLRGGMKDLTAMALLGDLGWTDVEIRRQPSGDGAVISLFGEGCDAASMVEPYATMMEELGIGRAVRRTGDVWPGVPGCSLVTTTRLREDDPDLVEAVVRAFVRGADVVRDEPAEAAAIAARYIGVHKRFIEAALLRNTPNVDAIRNAEAIDHALTLMAELGYLERPAHDFVDLTFLNRVAQPVR